MARSERRVRRRRALLVVPACMTAIGMIACNELIGLNAFQEGECNGSVVCQEPYGRDANAPEVDVFDASDARPDVVVDSGPPSAPVSWAKWPMGNGVGAGGAAGPSDAATGAPAPTFTATGDGWLKDEVTGLEWMPQTEARKTFEQAASSCSARNARLPSRIELVTLIAPESDGHVEAAFLTTTEEGAYWTMSEVRETNPTRRYWVVDFRQLKVTRRNASETDTAHVRCVRGGS